MNRTPMPWADFFTGLTLFILGVGMTVGGLMLPGPEDVSYIEIGGEPGKLPIVLGISISFLAFILILRAVKIDGLRPEQLAGRGQRDLDRIAIMRGTLTALGCSLYAVGLLGRKIGAWHIPYELATFGFLFLFVLAFEWPQASETASRHRHFLDRMIPAAGHGLDSLFSAVPASRRAQFWLAISAAVYALIMTIAVTYLFETQFLVTLP